MVLLWVIELTYSDQINFVECFFYKLSERNVSNNLRSIIKTTVNILESYINMSENQEFWFAARTRANQELGLRDSLRKLETTYYLPTHIVTRRISDRVKRVEVPVINNLIFVRTTKQQAFALVKDYALKLHYIKNIETGSLLVVPDKQMDNFMFLMDLSPESIRQSGDTYAPGDKVRIIKGNLTGVEGEMVRVEGKTHVVLRIPQVLAVSVKVAKSYLEKIR